MYNSPMAMISFPKILVLAVVQGLTELLPVSSSAHVIVAEKLMGLDPTLPAMTLLLVMLHTGTMLAVIVYFWNSWKKDLPVAMIITATVATGIVGMALKVIIEKVILKHAAHAEVESLFGNLLLISGALAAVGALILCMGFKKNDSPNKSGVSLMAACVIGAVQGLCLPFRGFSRSGATISTGLILGIEKKRIEDFSFALAVVLTPPVIIKEALRFLKAQHAAASNPHGAGILGLLAPSLIGMVLSFIAGLLALKWLSSWLETGKWYLFGFYCLCASVLILFLHFQGL